MCEQGNELGSIHNNPGCKYVCECSDRDFLRSLSKAGISQRNINRNIKLIAYNHPVLMTLDLKPIAIVWAIM